MPHHLTEYSSRYAGADDAEYAGELLPYIKGDKKAPLPTYFIGGYGAGSQQALASLEAAPECDIVHLGRAGVAQLKGLQVAYLDGTYNAAAFRAPGDASCRYYTSADADLLRHKVEAADGDIDLLLTNEWPEGVCHGLPEAAQPAGVPTDGKSTATLSTTLPHSRSHNPSQHNIIFSQLFLLLALIVGSSAAADAALAARPRYHVAAGKRAFWARAPYLNSDLGAGAHATRFIALADVGNAAKQKWLHALGLAPAATMTPEALSAAPAGSTPSPYAAAAASRKRSAAAADDDGLGDQTWRWQDRGKRARAPPAAPSLGRADVARDRAKTVFARNVPFRATEEDLVAFFSQAGAVVDVVRRANAEGRLNSFCHVQYAEREGMERACQLNGSELMGRQVFIEPASTEDTPRAAKVAKPVDGCWFCLSNPNADVELVASVGEPLNFFDIVFHSHPMLQHMLLFSSATLLSTHCCNSKCDATSTLLDRPALSPPSIQYSPAVLAAV